MKKIALPEPLTSGGRSLIDALRERSSYRSFDPKPISPEQLSTLLWAAFGINRPDSGKRTAPSACNIQEMKIYAITADGAYLYDPTENCLQPVVKKDLRKIAAVQPDFKHAPLHLVYVADYSHNKEVDADKKERFLQFSHAHAGFIGQNVYLYCASAGLRTCFVASIDQPGLSKALGLAEDQYPLYTQIVGYPGK